MCKQENPIRDWLADYERDPDAAVRQVVDVFYDRLVGLAKKRLASMPPQVADDEGAVISALRSFFSGVENGQFSRIADEYDLWRVLATVTARKSIRQLRVHFRQRGEGHRVDREHDLALLLNSDVTPEQEAMLIEECERCLDLTGDQTLKKITQLKLDGLTTHQIAEQVDLNVRSVQRKLKLIESIWLDAIGDDA